MDVTWSLCLLAILCAGSETSPSPAPPCSLEECGPPTLSGFEEMLENLRDGVVNRALSRFHYTQASFEHWFTDMTVQNLQVVESFRSTNTLVAYGLGQMFDDEFLTTIPWDRYHPDYKRAAIMVHNLFNFTRTFAEHRTLMTIYSEYQYPRYYDEIPALQNEPTNERFGLNFTLAQTCNVLAGEAFYHLLNHPMVLRTAHNYYQHMAISASILLCLF